MTDDTPYRLSVACGVPVIVPDYRLTPEFVSPQGLRKTAWRRTVRC